MTFRCGGALTFLSCPNCCTCFQSTLKCAGVEKGTLCAIEL